jgi:chromosome segregation ATPase
MNNKIPVLHCKLKRYERKSKQKSKDGKNLVNRRYMIPIKKDQIEGSKFQEVDNIVVLSLDDFEYELQKSEILNLSHEKIKQSLNDKKLEINDLKEQISQIKNDDKKIDDLKDNLDKEHKLKIDNIVNEFETEINNLNDEIKNLNNENSELNIKLRTLRDLDEKFKIKLNEYEMTFEECEKLKKSHELLWDVVEKKDKKIKELEKRSIVDNIFGKIRK